MLINLTADELRALQDFLVAPLRGLDPDEPGLSEGMRRRRLHEQSYISARSKLEAALKLCSI